MTQLETEALIRKLKARNRLLRIKLRRLDQQIREKEAEIVTQKALRNEIANFGTAKHEMESRLIYSMECFDPASEWNITEVQEGEVN